MFVALPPPICLVTASAPTAPADALLAAFQARETMRSQAIAAGDAATLDSIYAPDFEGVTSRGALVDKAGLMAIFARAASRGTTAPPICPDVQSVRRDGAIAWVRGELPFPDHRTAFLHIYRKSGQSWQIVGGIATEISVDAAR